MRPIDADTLLKRPIWFCGGWVGDSYAEGYMDALDKVEEAIKSEPTIEMPRWIPCSERLPEYLNYVLLSSSEYGLKIGARTRKSNFDSWYINEPLDCDVWHVIGSNCMYDFEDFTAWMPLPRPYEVRKDNETDIANEDQILDFPFDEKDCKQAI